MTASLAALLLIQSLLIAWDHKAHRHEIDHIEIFKSKHLLTLKSQGRIVGRYPASFGYHPGKKEQSGDKKTPEGQYHIIGKNKNSIFTHSLHISYPNPQDKAHAEKLGVDPGNEITIHGTGNDQTLQKEMRALRNWTRGCIALNDAHIRSIYPKITIGTPVTIHP